MEKIRILTPAEQERRRKVKIVISKMRENKKKFWKYIFK